MPPLVSRLGSSLRTTTRAPIGSTYSNTFFPAFGIDMDLIRVKCVVNTGVVNKGVVDTGVVDTGVTATGRRQDFP